MQQEVFYNSYLSLEWGKHNLDHQSTAVDMWIEEKANMQESAVTPSP